MAAFTRENLEMDNFVYFNFVSFSVQYTHGKSLEIIDNQTSFAVLR
mgnify:FL=1